MDQAFPIAKIQPPRVRQHLVRRTTLEAALAQALTTRRIVALVAPAGFGKTVALTGGLGLLDQGHARAWLSCDADDDAARVLACLVTALEPYDLPWRTAPEALVAGAAGTSKARTAALASFVDTLAATDVAHGVLAFDDLHQWREAATLVWLGHLVEWLPPRWTVALASRELL